MTRAFVAFYFSMFCLSGVSVHAQDAGTPASFAAIYGESRATFLSRSIAQTPDGGYIIAGDKATTVLSALVMKFTAGGSISWQKTYTFPGQPSDGYLIRPVSNGYILVASLGQQTGAPVLAVMNLDPSGTVLWQFEYPTGGDIGAAPFTIEQTADGGYLLGGIDFDSSTFFAPLWGVKLDASGNIVWQKVFGLNPGTIHATSDGGFIVSGYTLCSPRCEAEVAKVDQAGNIVWQKLYLVGVDNGFAGSARETPDGGYIVGGEYYIGSTNGYGLAMKLDSSGNVVWQQGFTTPLCLSTGAYDAQAAPGGGYFLFLGAGCSSNGGVVKLDANGALLWQEQLTYSGTHGLNVLTDWFQPTHDGGYIATGSIGSLTFLPRLLNVKVDRNGVLANCGSVSTVSLQVTTVTPPANTVTAANLGTADTTVIAGASAATEVAEQLKENNACKLP